MGIHLIKTRSCIFDAVITGDSCNSNRWLFPDFRHINDDYLCVKTGIIIPPVWTYRQVDVLNLKFLTCCMYLLITQSCNKITHKEVNFSINIYWRLHITLSNGKVPSSSWLLWVLTNIFPTVSYVASLSNKFLIPSVLMQQCMSNIRQCLSSMTLWRDVSNCRFIGWSIVVN